MKEALDHSVESKGVPVEEGEGGEERKRGGQGSHLSKHKMKPKCPSSHPDLGDSNSLVWILLHQSDQ